MFKAVVCFFTCTIVLLSCKSINNELQAEGEPDHDELMMSTTCFTDSLEFFNEFPPLVVNEDVEITIHVTSLQTYKPVSEALLTVEIDGVPKEATESPYPGIYMLSLTVPDKTLLPLRYKFNYRQNTTELADTLKIFENEEQAHAGIAGNARQDAVSFSKEEAWNNDFMVERTEPGPFAAVIRASGEILAMPGEKYNVIASASGIIAFATSNLVQGSSVVKGQKLFTISGKDLAGNNVTVQLTESRARYMQSKSEWERYRALYKENLVSQKQFMEAQSSYLTDSAAWYAFTGTSINGGLQVISPRTGYLHELNISEGQYITEGMLLATISDNEVLLLRADVPQQHYTLLNEIESANFRTAYSGKTYTLEDMNGKLLAKGASVAENNHYMPVYFEVFNDGSLLEGAFAEFWLKTKQKTNCIAIPLTALVEEQGNYYVYRQVTGDTYIKQQVRRGYSDGIKVNITEGIDEGSRVVTRGAMILKAVSMSSSLPADTHQH